MKDFSVKKLAIASLLMALTIIATIIITIPIPATNGYIHLGDVMVLVSSTILGPVFGGLVGGIGSAMADLIKGYPHWIIFTLIIKTVEGMVFGYFVKKNNSSSKLNLSMIIGIILSILIMVVGYYFASVILTGNFISPLTSVPANLIQGIAGGVLYTILYSKLNEIKKSI